MNASYNELYDLEPLSGMQWLNVVNVDYNTDVDDVEPLADCPNLIKVDLFGTQVTDVSSLTQQSIIVNYNPTDIDVDLD